MSIDYKNYKLTPMPDRIKRLKVCPVRGVPVPWFVIWEDGKPEFRGADPLKLQDAILVKKCWVCGDYLGRHQVFVIGPMCGLNRISSEPPSHLECAEWSARNCPFLSKPHMVRREDEEFLAKASKEPNGVMLMRNPGVTLLWSTQSYALVPGNNSGAVLFKIGEPTNISWWREGRPATRAEVIESIDTGMPSLRELCVSQSDMDELERLRKAFEKYLPKDTIGQQLRDYNAT
jgi:hypothetical protein